MGSRVLVAHASKRGGTGEIAEEIGRVLRDAGLDVDVVPADRAGDPSAYDAVVLGSAVYIGRWRKEAVKFLEAHAETLADRKVWFFSSGPTGEGDPLELVEGVLVPEALQPVVDQIEPQDVTVFHGILDASELNFIERRMIKMVKAPLGDFRDWDAIRSWAEAIAAELKEAG